MQVFDKIFYDIVFVAGYAIPVNISPLSLTMPNLVVVPPYVDPTANLFSVSCYCIMNE